MNLYSWSVHPYSNNFFRPKNWKLLQDTHLLGLLLVLVGMAPLVVKHDQVLLHLLLVLAVDLGLSHALAGKEEETSHPSSPGKCDGFIYCQTLLTYSEIFKHSSTF